MTKILVIRFSSIGDIVLTSPVIRCLKKQVPGSVIHFLTKESFAPLMRNNPNVSNVYSIRKDIGEVLGKLKKENYNFIIDLHHNLRTARVKMALLRPASSFNKLNVEKWLYVKLKINRMPDTHVVDRYMETVKSLGVVNDGEGLDFFIPDKDRVELEALPPAFRNGYIGFVIGAKHATKQLPLEKIVSICNGIKLPVLLLGGKEDKQKGEKIISLTTGIVFNACGKFSLNQSASLIQQALKIVTHDTGLMHIAAALDKKILSVWGSTVPEFGMYPYRKSYAGSEGAMGEMAQVTGLSCRPCSKLGFKKCPKGHFKCMNDLDEGDIIRFCNTIP